MANIWRDISWPLHWALIDAVILHKHGALQLLLSLLFFLVLCLHKCYLKNIKDTRETKNTYYMKTVWVRPYSYVFCRVHCYLVQDSKKLTRDSVCVCVSATIAVWKDPENWKLRTACSVFTFHCTFISNVNRTIQFIYKKIEMWRMPIERYKSLATDCTCHGRV